MLVLATMVAGTASSCSKDVEPGNGRPGDAVTYTCIIASDPDSKVAISETGKTTWEPGDQIIVHGEYTGSGKSDTVTLTAGDISADGKKATISFSGVAPYDRSSDKGYTSTIYAAYPASSVKDNDHCYYYSNFVNTNAPLMAAYNVGNTFVFYNLCGVIAYKASGNFDSVVFSGNNEETVGYSYYRTYLVQKNTGSPRLEYNYTSDGGTNGPLTECSGKVVADGSTMNYIGIPNGVSFSQGFTFKFYKDGDLVKMARTEKALNLPRNKMLYLGDITSKLETPSGSDSHTSSIPTDDAINLCADGTANCYMVNDPGVYKLRMVRGNVNVSIGKTASVEVLWENYGGSEAVTPGSVVSEIDFEGSWMYFRVPEQFHDGNALVAAKDEGGNILWSWHIWMTSYSVDVDSYGLSAYQFMTRNLGAIADASANGNAGPETFGLLYQWGRKDPFPGAAGAGVNSASAIAGKAMTLHGGQMTVDQTIAAPTEFADYNGDWTTVTDRDLWGDVSKIKSVYDPCPPGYKVPRREDATAFFSVKLTDGSAGWAYKPDQAIFTVGDPVAVFPLTGYINYDGSYSATGSRTMIWNAHDDGDVPNKAYGQYVYEGPSSSKSAQTKARGCTVRCISETKAPFINEQGMPVMGSYTKTDFTSAQMAELSGLCFSKDGDFMWGVGDGGTLYKIGFDMSVSVQMNPTQTSEADLEGVTMDPVTKDLYFCCEPNRVRKTTAPNYNTITKIFEVADAANFGNSGLEGITYYKDNVLYVGSQSGAYLWAYNVNGTMIWKKQLATIAPYIQEVGDLYYDPATDLLWISDSEAFKLFVFDGSVTKLKAMYDISFIGNPESVLVDHTRNCVWVGDDRGSSSRIYKISFTGLN